METLELVGGGPEGPHSHNERVGHHRLADWLGLGRGQWGEGFRTSKLRLLVLVTLSLIFFWPHFDMKSVFRK